KSPASVSETSRRDHSTSLIPSSCSSSTTCFETAGWLMPSSSAADENDLLRANAANARSRASSLITSVYTNAPIMYFFLGPISHTFLACQPTCVGLIQVSPCSQWRKPMPAFICSTCGTQYPPSEAAPAHCPVCEDERQFIPPEGQSWTTLERLRISHHNGFRQYEPGLIGIGTT